MSEFEDGAPFEVMVSLAYLHVRGKGRVAAGPVLCMVAFKGWIGKSHVSTETLIIEKARSMRTYQV